MCLQQKTNALVSAKQDAWVVRAENMGPIRAIPGTAGGFHPVPSAKLGTVCEMTRKRSQD